MPVAAAGGLLAVVIGAGLWSGRNSGSTAAEATGPTTASTIAPVATAVPTTVQYAATETVVTSTPIQKTALDRTLGNGVTGDDVRRLQTRLVELGFNPGPVDGQYGSMTIQSVWAYEKLVMQTPRAEATGRVTPEMWSAMQDPIAIKPRRSTGGLADHVEIYLPEQVMVVFHGDVPALVTHISTGELDPDGTPAAYCDEATINERNGVALEEPVTGIACGEAKTPGGVFTIKRMVEGKRVSALGGMNNPVYFNYGIAIHGADNVPLEPASHGCIRISQTLSETFQTLVAKGDRVLVWNGEKEPEDVSEDESLPWFDTFTPDSTTTTSTTSTTTTSTTVPVAVTTPATTTSTTSPAATTTTSTTTTSPATTTTVATPGTVAG